MAVYTHLSPSSIETLLSEYTIGTLVSYRPIEAGIENTNYNLTTSTGRFILTVYEKRVQETDLPFYLGLMRHLQQQGVPCPVPLCTQDGKLYTSIDQKPCAIVSFLEGKSVVSLQNIHLQALGTSMAKMHLASLSFPMQLPNRFLLSSWHELFTLVRPLADTLKPGLAEEIAYHLHFIESHWPSDLPEGIIHGDLFPDNVFFTAGTLSGIIDFYFSCSDFLMYDLAICLNAWCFEHGSDFNITKARLLLTHYHDTRPLSEKELSALPVLASGSALRFLLTRLYDWLHRPNNALVTPKDPLEYLRKLRFHHNIRSHLEYGL